MRRYLQVFFAHKWLVIIAAVTVFTTTTIITLTTPPTYRATAKVYVEQKIEQQLFAPPPLSGQDIRIFLQTQLELICSRTVAKRTLEELGMAQKTGGGERLTRQIESLQARISAGSRTGLESKPSEAGLGHSFIIFVSVDDSDPAQAAALVNTICEKYQEFFFEVKGSQNVKAYRFLKEHLEVIEKDLQKSDRKLRDFELKQGKNLVELMNLRRGTLSVYDDYSNFLVDYNKAVVELKAGRANLKELEKQLGQERVEVISEKSLGRGKPVAYIEEKILALQEELAGLKSKYTREYTPIVQLEEQITDLNSVLEKTRRGNVAGQYLDAYMRVVELREKVDSLEEINRDYAERLDQLVNAKTTYSQLVREQEAADKVFMRHIEEVENARLTMFSDLSKVANVYILDKARLPIPKIKPKVKMNIALAAIMGILLGLGLAYLADYLDHTIKTVEDVEDYLKRPLLMSLPSLSRYFKETT